MKQSSETITIYDAANTERISIHAWKTMFKELWEFRELIHRLVLRNIAGAFRQSFLSYLWIALPPIATTLIFTMLRKANIVNVTMPEEAMPYALFALIGTTIWQYFTQVTMMSTNCITGAGNLVSKIYFPREVLVLSAAGSAIVNLLIRTVIVVLTFALLGYLPHGQALLFPVILIPLTAFGLGLGLLFAPFNTMMHDVGRLMAFGFQFGMFLAPTVYPTPNPITAVGWQKVLYWLHTLNPVSHFIHSIDSMISTGSFEMGVGFIIATGISFLTLLVGWRFFHICEPLLAERM